MKHIKSYENTTEDEPQIGDYVIAVSVYPNEEITIFLKTHIGKVILKDYNENNSFISVEYDEIIPTLNQKSWIFVISDDKTHNDAFLYISKNKKDCEIYLKTSKYNL